MTRPEGYGCSFGKLGTLAGLVMKGTKVSHLRSQHGDSIEENLSPRSVLEHRVLSGLAIAIDLEEKRYKPSNTQNHVVLGRYCCTQNIHHVNACQEDHNYAPGSSRSRERLTQNTHENTHEEKGTASDVAVVGLRMVSSSYPMLYSSSPEKRLSYSEMGGSVSKERMYIEAMRCNESEKHAYRLAGKDGERNQHIVCSRKMKVSMSSSPPLRNVKKLQSASCESEENGECSQGDRRFRAGRSMEESIFYYVNPSSSDAFHLATTDSPLFGSLGDDFLKTCCFCKCHLGVGKDIYIYRGDQAFCSAECRYQQIMIDECMVLTA